MPIGIFVDSPRDLTTFDCFGDVFFVDIIEAMLTFFEGIESKPTGKLIWDMRKIEYFDLSPYQLDKLADLYMSKNNGVRAAILSPTKPVHTITKAFERRVPENKRDFKIFKSKEDTDEWLEN